jgi:integral membrane protein
VSPRTQVHLFRVIATAEAISWVGLLTGMYFKYLTDAGELGVKIFGPLHGGIFVAYVLLTLLVSRTAGWGRWTTLAGLACSVPPFATLAFEVWAQRTGRLSVPVRRSSAEPLDTPAMSGDSHR